MGEWVELTVQEVWKIWEDTSGRTGMELYQAYSNALRAKNDKPAEQTAYSKAIEDVIHGGLGMVKMTYIEPNVVQLPVEKAEQTAQYSDIISDGGLDPRNATGQTGKPFTAIDTRPKYERITMMIDGEEREYALVVKPA